MASCSLREPPVGHRRRAGFTLAELLVVMAVIGILAGVVMPGFRGLVERNRLTSAANDMVLAINYARSEAMRLGQEVRVVPVGASVAGNEWGQGWRVVTGAADEVLRRFPPLEPPLQVAGVDGVTQLSFNNQGLLQATSSVTLRLCLPGDGGLDVVVAPTGRPSTARLTAAQCEGS